MFVSADQSHSVPCGDHPRLKYAEKIARIASVLDEDGHVAASETDR